MRSYLWIGVAAFLMSAIGRAAPDANTVAARSHVQAGIAFYDDGKYEEAAREMEAAYKLKPLADLQYNLAQCYERLGRLADAAEAYRKYLAGKPEAEDRDNISARIASLEQRIAAARAGQAAPPPPPVEKVVLKTVVVYREAPPPPGRGARFAAYGLGALALAGLASGIAFAVLAKQDADYVSTSGNALMPPPFDGRVADTQSAGRTDEIVSWVSFGAAAVCAAGAVGLWALGRHIDKEAAAAAQQVAVVPTASPSGGGLLVAGSF
jgi:tetratricopeptide (TPR) repeat protein